MPKDTFDIPLSGGLDTKADPRVVSPPALRVCKNVEFTELGGLQKRKPRSAFSTDVHTDSPAIADIRKVVSYGDELLLFTKDHLYSWSDDHSEWYSRGTYRAPKITEQTRFTSNSERENVDYATLNGVGVFVWTANDITTSFSEEAQIAAVDEDTGAVLLSPRAIGGGLERARVVATTNRFIVVGYDSSTTKLRSRVFDPADLLTNFASGTFTDLWTSATEDFDVFADGTKAVFAAVGTTAGDYRAGSVDESSTLVEDTKSRGGSVFEKIAICKQEVATGYVIVFHVSNFLIYDRLDSAFLDVTTSVAFDGAAFFNDAAGQITVVCDDADKAWVFIGEDAEVGPDLSAGDEFQTWYARINTTTDSVELTAARFVIWTEPVSRAFIHDGEAYIWLAFDCSSTVKLNGVNSAETSTQSTYMLFRAKTGSEPDIVAVAVKDAAGGFRKQVGLSGVQSTGTNTYVWGTEERRAIRVGDEVSTYTNRSPRVVTLEFDSNEARRTARLGRTLYVTGGQVMQYDGEGLTEVNFHTHPWGLDVTSTAGVDVGAGTYSYLSSYRWDNAKGEADRSTTASLATVELAASEEGTIHAPSTAATLKHYDDLERVNIALEHYRTLKNTGSDSPFYKVTSSDPSDALLTANEYEESRVNDAIRTLSDEDPDADVDDNEIYRETGAVLGSLAPPPASIIVAEGDRIFLAGIASYPHRIWYSKQRAADEVAAFNDGLIIDMAEEDGAVTGMAFLNNTLIVFQERGVHALPGNGFANDGSGQNFGPAQVLSSDVGATSPDTIARTPDGIFFFSQKGWYLLDRGWTVRYIGAPVEAFNSDTFTAVHVLEKEHQIRCFSSNRILVFDMVAKQWSEWTHENAVTSATFHKGVYYLAGDSAIYTEDATHGNPTNYSMQIETAWLKVKGLADFGRVRYVTATGEYRSDHGLLIDLARDYDDATYFQSKEFQPKEDANSGDPLQVRHGPKIQKMQALKVRITDVSPGSADATSPPTGESLTLTGLTLEVGLKKGTARVGSRIKQ